MLEPQAKYLLDYGTLAQDQACTYACSGLTAYAALKKAAPLHEADPLLIIGAGGVGLSAIRLARQMYATPPIVAEIWRVIAQIRATGIATLIVDRDYRRVLAQSDRALVLQKGQVVLAGDSAELRANPALGAYLGV